MSGNIRQKLFDIYNLIDQQFSDGKFSEIDNFLLCINCEDYSPTEIVGILTITSHAPKENLPSRDAFVKRAELFLIDKLGEERALKLLKSRR